MFTSIPLKTLALALVCAHLSFELGNVLGLVLHVTGHAFV